MTTTDRVLVLACSATKRPDPAPLPAIERYDGPLWRTLRAVVTAIDQPPRIFVLSAEFGVLAAEAPIPFYERRLDPLRAEALAADADQRNRLAAAVAGAAETYIAGGALYRSTVRYMLAMLQQAGLVRADLSIITLDGLGLGHQRAALRAWLTAGHHHSGRRNHGD